MEFERRYLKGPIKDVFEPTGSAECPISYENKIGK
jgi:hypothetical protein